MRLQDAPFGCVASEGGAPFVARRAMNLHGCALPHCAPPPTATPPDPPIACAFRAGFQLCYRSCETHPWIGLHVVSQHQFDGVRMEEHLAGEVGDVVLADVMTDQGDGDDQGDEPKAVLIDHLDHLLFFNT